MRVKRQVRTGKREERRKDGRWLINWMGRPEVGEDGTRTKFGEKGRADHKMMLGAWR